MNLGFRRWCSFAGRQKICYYYFFWVLIRYRVRGLSGRSIKKKIIITQNSSSRRSSDVHEGPVYYNQKCSPLLPSLLPTRSRRHLPRLSVPPVDLPALLIHPKPPQQIVRPRRVILERLTVPGIPVGRAHQPDVVGEVVPAPTPARALHPRLPAAQGVAASRVGELSRRDVVSGAGVEVEDEEERESETLWDEGVGVFWGLLDHGPVSPCGVPEVCGRDLGVEGGHLRFFVFG